MNSGRPELVEGRSAVGATYDAACVVAVSIAEPQNGSVCRRPRTLVAVLTLALGCAAPVAASARSLAPLSASADDPVLVLIADSDRHFKAGQKELEQGHFEAAKKEFNLAVDVLLESAYGARSEPRVREHFDKLVDRISAYEVQALAEGDGFTRRSRPGVD